MPLTSKVTVGVTGHLSAALDLVTATAPLAYEKAISLDNGTAADMADRVFSDERTLAGSATEDLDLAGVLVDALGATITFARIRALIVENLSTGANQVIVGGAPTNTWVGPFGAAAQTVSVRPGGMLAMVNRDTTGWPVTAATGDLLRIANSTTGSVTYRIVIIGCSA